MALHKPTFARIARLFALATACTSLVSFAGSITNVSVVNVTPSSFSIVWRGVANDSSAVQIFADAAGQSNITSKLGVELYPLHTGNPNFLEGYERRQSRADLRAKTKSQGWVHAKMRNGTPGATYYYRLISTSGGSTNFYPATGLAVAQLPEENSFVLNSQQLIIDIPGVDQSGRIVLLSHSDGTYPLAAVVGDGTGTNQVFFNLNDIFAMTGGNLSPTDATQFLVTITGPGQTDEQQFFNVAFTEGFAVGGANTGTTAEDFLVVSVGSGVYRTGVTNELAIELNSSPLADCSITISLPDGRFDKLALKPARGQIDPSQISLVKGTGTNYTLSFRAAAGNAITGQGAAVLLSFVSTNHTSAFVPVRISSVTARKADTTALPPLLVTSGRMVLVGNEPLVEATVESTGRKLTLYGKPWSSYEVQGTSDMRTSGNWQLITRVPMTNMIYSIAGLNTNPRTQFFRALEFVADPPLIEVAGNSESLRLYGKAGQTYAVQYTSNLSGVVQWHPLLNYTFTNSFGTVAGMQATNNSGFFRLAK